MGRVLRFGIVGAIGFALDAGVLQMLLVLGWGPVPARAVAIPVAVLATWALNRSFTFREALPAPALASLVRYAGVSATGAAVNFAAYTALVLGGVAPIASMAVSSLVAMSVNYLGSKHYAFRA